MLVAEEEHIGQSIVHHGAPTVALARDCVDGSNEFAHIRVRLFFTPRLLCVIPDFEKTLSGGGGNPSGQASSCGSLLQL